MFTFIKLLIVAVLILLVLIDCVVLKLLSLTSDSKHKKYSERDDDE